MAEFFSNIAFMFSVASDIWYIVLPPILYFLFMLLWGDYVGGKAASKMEWVLLEIIPPREVETAITGNLSSVTDAELQYLPESVRENGARLISVDADTTVSNGDHIRITEPDDTTTLWKVEKEKTTTNFLDIVGMRRRQYYISKCL